MADESDANNASSPELCLTSIMDRHNSTLQQMLVFSPQTVQLVRLLLPLWVAVGVPGSLVSLAVWSSRQLRSASSVYLCAIAVLDAVFLLFQQLPWHLHTSYDIRLVDNAAICAAFPVFSLWLQYLSPMLILAFTVERFAAIFHPFGASRNSTARRSLCVSCCLGIGCLPLALVQLSFFHYSPDKGQCVEEERIFNQTTVLHGFYHAWTKTTEILFFALVPLAILVFNALVLSRARRSLRLQRSRPNGFPAVVVGGGGAGRRRAATVTLLCVSFYQIGATLPVSVMLFAGYHMESTDLGAMTCNMTDVEVAEAMSAGRLPGVSDYFRHASVSSLTAALVVSHNAVKMFIYLATGAAFRRQLRRMLTRLCPALLGGGKTANLQLRSQHLLPQHQQQWQRQLRRRARRQQSEATAENIL